MGGAGMRLLPAIDLIAGRTVRLRRGDYGAEIRYDSSPAEAAVQFLAAGALELHIVDLDGARAGRPEQLDSVSAIRAAVDIPIELGGGLRTLDDLRSADSIGVDRFILGTAAVENPRFATDAASEFGDRVVVSIDARGGKAATSGWTEQSGHAVADLVKRFEDSGVKRFVYSAIERDGMLAGPALDEIVEVGTLIPGRFSYAGGVSSLADVEALRDLRVDNLDGVIVGRAVHEGLLDIAEANELLGS